MKKSLSAVFVILLSVLGFKSEASIFDHNVQRSVKQASEVGGIDNEGSKACGSKHIKF